MTACFLALALACARPAPTPAPAPLDPGPASAADAGWGGEDGPRHFALSFAATGMGYAGARTLLPAAASRVAAPTLALALGFAKEIADARGRTGFSLADLAWDAAGVAVGVALIHQIR